MTEYYHEQREKYITLALSLLIHIILIFGLLQITHQQIPLVHTKLFFTHEQPLDEIKKAEQKQQEQGADKSILAKDDQTAETVAALKPRASSFGVPLVFQEEAEQQPALFEPHAQELISQEMQEADQQEAISTEQKHKEEVVQEAPQEEAPQKLQKPPQEQEQQEQKQAEKQADIQEPTKEPIAVPAENKNGLHEIQEPNITAKAQEKSPEQKEVVFHDIAVSPPKQQVRKKESESTTARSAGPIKRQLTFADLAQGFIESIKNEGQDWLEREGDPNKRPDMKELRYLSYVQKLVWYMQNEWKSTMAKVSHLNFSQDLILCVIVTIAKNGSLQGIQIVQPSGSDELDSFLTSGIKHASPYPPIPQFLNTESFDFPLAIHNYPNQNSPWKMRLSPPHI